MLLDMFKTMSIIVWSKFCIGGKFDYTKALRKYLVGFEVLIKTITKVPNDDFSPKSIGVKGGICESVLRL